MTSLTKDQAGSIFDKVVETCEKELYDPKLKGVDWRRIAEIRKARILTAADEAEFEHEFNDLIRELRVSHAGFYHVPTRFSRFIVLSVFNLDSHNVAVVSFPQAFNRLTIWRPSRPVPVPPRSRVCSRCFE